MTQAQKFLAIPVIAGLTIIGGAVAGFASLASAQSTGTSSNTTSAPTAQIPHNRMRGNFDPHKGGHIGANGTKEELLTGESAAKATAAALAAIPGATIERVETDAEGATYEAHMEKSDGSHTTVKMDTNFNVTSTENGPGPRGRMHQAPAQQ